MGTRDHGNGRVFGTSELVLQKPCEFWGTGPGDGGDGIPGEDSHNKWPGKEEAINEGMQWAANGPNEQGREVPTSSRRDRRRASHFLVHMCIFNVYATVGSRTQSNNQRNV